jgi:glycyl-tRNA synthetase beta subunit
MSSRKIACIISGNSYTFAKDYFQKKVEEYGDEDSLKKYFITRKVKTLLNKGYSVNDVRNILGVDDENLPDTDSEEIKAMIEFHRVRNKGKNKRVSNTLNFATLKSDPDVAAFINTISQYEN